MVKRKGNILPVSKILFTLFLMGMVKRKGNILPVSKILFAFLMGMVKRKGNILQVSKILFVFLMGMVKRRKKSYRFQTLPSSCMQSFVKTQDERTGVIFVPAPKICELVRLVIQRISFILLILKILYNYSDFSIFLQIS